MEHDDCARVAALGPSAALGALDAEDAAFVREHLRACGLTHPELREWLAVAGAIGEALSDEDLPSPGLRDRVLDAARRDTVASTSGTVEGTRRSRDPWRVAAMGAGSLALAASLLLAMQIGEGNGLRDRVDQGEARIAALETELVTAQARIERAVARGATAYFMDGEGEAPGASFMLVVERESAGAVLLVSSLPQLDDGETYELWVERDGEVVAIGTFVPDASGLAAVTIDASLAGIGQAMVTIEPEGGSDQPSAEDVVMRGELST